jgi:putative nucleotidyltransferase with HDIG domain
LSRSQIQDCLKNLQAALKAAALYPEHHPGIQAPLNAAFRGLTSLLESGHPVVLGIVDDVLVLDEIPFYETDTLWSTLFTALRNRGIESITFRQGIDPKELLGIIWILKGGEAQDPTDLATVWKEKEIVRATYREIDEIDDLHARANQTYNESLGVVVNLVTELRMGKIPSSEGAFKVINGMRDLILQDTNALFGMAMMKEYDNYTFNHSVNVAIFSLALAQQLQLPPDECRKLGLAALLHDMGKVRTDEAIIKKAGTLDDEEMRLMKLHPQLGAEILESMQGMHSDEITMVLQHHVRLDGKGYPELSSTADIHPLAQGIGLADCYDALTTTRPYQRSRHPSDAAHIIRLKVGTHFSSHLAEQFLTMLGTYPVGDAVRLATGEIGVVIENGSVDATTPVVRLVIDAEGNPLPVSRRIELSDPSEDKRRIVAPVDPLIKGIDVAAILAENSGCD